MLVVWVALGGALGSAARYGLGNWALQRFGPVFPYGTLFINVSGSFLMALLMSLSLRPDAFSPALRLALTTGVLGGFTTYSTFNHDTLLLLQQGHWISGAANLLATVLGGLLAGALGLAAGRLLGGA